MLRSQTLFLAGRERGRRFTFTTSPANGVLEVRLADGQFVAAYLSRAGHATA